MSVTTSRLPPSLSDRNFCHSSARACTMTRIPRLLLRQHADGVGSVDANWLNTFGFVSRTRTTALLDAPLHTGFYCRDPAYSVANIFYIQALVSGSLHCNVALFIHGGCFRCFLRWTLPHIFSHHTSDFFRAGTMYAMYVYARILFNEKSYSRECIYVWKASGFANFL